MLSDSGVKLVIYIIWLHWKVWAEIRGGKPWHNSFSCLTPHLRKVNSYPAFLYRFFLFRRVLELEDKGKWKATSYIWTCFSSPFLHQIFFLCFHHSSFLWSLFYILFIWRWRVKFSCANCAHGMIFSAYNCIILLFHLRFDLIPASSWNVDHIFCSNLAFHSFPIIHPVLSM